MNLGAGLWSGLADRLSRLADELPVDRFQLLLLVHVAGVGLGLLAGLLILPILLAHPHLARPVLGGLLGSTGLMVALDMFVFFPLAGWLGRRGRERATLLLRGAWLVLTTLHGTYVAHLCGSTNTSWLLLLPGGALATSALLGTGYGLFALVAGTLFATAMIALEVIGFLPFAPLTPGIDTSYYLGFWPVVQSLVVMTMFGLAAWLGVVVLFRLLERTRQELVRAESMAVVGSLVSGIAHQLGNPLGSSRALLQSLRSDLSSSLALPEGEKRDALESIDMALHAEARAGAIVGRLYELSEILGKEGALWGVGEVLDSLRERYPAVTIESAGGLDPRIRVRARFVETILANLLDNALAAGGQEPPTLRAQPVSSPGVRGGAAADPRIEFVVRDCGRGIAAAERAEVFKPFFTGHVPGAGTGVGLGLYIVYELAVRIGAQVDLQSEPGQGTRVSVRVPAEGGRS